MRRIELPTSILPIWHSTNELHQLKRIYNMDFTLNKKDLPQGTLHSDHTILNWTREQQEQNKKCLYCDAWGSFAIQPKDSFREYYFLCGDHYSSEKIEKKI